jgi:YidC/Oxa1 family membrane protein insertase
MSDLNLNQNNSSGNGKNMIIAVVLMVLVITAGVVINDIFFPMTPSQTTTAASPQSAAQPATAALPSPAASGVRAADSGFVAAPVQQPAGSGASAGAAGTAAASSPAEARREQQYKVSTDLLDAVFTNKGGDLVSLKLKKHKDNQGDVDLILPGQTTDRAFTVSFGDKDSVPVEDLMDVRMLDETTIEFSRTYLADIPGKADPQAFVYRKVYSFHNGEYLFGLAINFENSSNEYIPLDKKGTAYTLSFAPQIGPSFNPLSKNSDYRKILVYAEGKKREEKIKNAWSLKDQPKWIGLAGKYFVFLEVPGLSSYTANLSSANVPDFGQTTRIDLSRPAIKTNRQSDVYYFYFGPKTTSDLRKYNYEADNAFKLSGLDFEQAMDGSSFFHWIWLENGLKFILGIFFKLIPNYGVAIILVTLLVKGLLFPLTKKGSIASAQMQEVQPKMQALQEKYKNNPEKLNKEMAEFYKNEGVNPMSGCLPMLIQIPIFFAMYNLFNTHFDLRGAMFIPGWIPDLSLGESVWNFAPTKIPLLGWSDLRLLPIIYLLSQIFYAKFTQQPGQTGPQATQMKFMMFGMPIIFFFILYDVPSGLLVYWIFSNLFTIIQQVAINNILKTRKANLAAATAAGGGNTIAFPVNVNSKAKGKKAAAVKSQAAAASKAQANKKNPPSGSGKGKK